MPISIPDPKVIDAKSRVDNSLESFTGLVAIPTTKPS